ncbi:MAG: GNAT family N-acetyltransferase [Anaerolineae bacterium]|jgi:GNAT superfamily N-acetyltransferase
MTEYQHPESFRLRPATLEDAEAIADLVNECSIERTGKPRVTAQQVFGVLQTPGLDLETDTLLAIDPDGQFSGFALVQDTAPHTLFFVLADVHPRCRGLGIGSTLCRWAEDRARRSMPQAPTGERVVLLQQRLSTDQAARELLLGQGYRVARHNYRMAVELDAPPPQPAVPPGITIRPFDRDREARALVRALREAFRDNWGYVERPFEEEVQRWMHLLDRDPDHDPAPFWFVAVDGEEIAGFCLCNPREAGDAEMAWIHVVGVRPPWRRRGLALALLHHSFGALYRQGKHRIALEVDTQSSTGATQLYEKAGMRVERQYDFFEKELRAG